MSREPSRAVGAAASLGTRARAATPPRPSHGRAGRTQSTCVRRCVGRGSRRQQGSHPTRRLLSTLTPTSCPWTGRAGCQTTASTCAPAGEWSRRGRRSWWCCLCGRQGVSTTNENRSKSVFFPPISVSSSFLLALAHAPAPRVACRVCATRAATRLRPKARAGRGHRPSITRSREGARGQHLDPRRDAPRLHRSTHTHKKKIPC